MPPRNGTSVSEEVTGGEAARPRILDKALEKFKALGYAKTTMDEIAAELGMSKKTLYKSFPAKLDLMEALVQQNFDHINARCDAILASPISAIEKLAAVSQVIVDQQERFVSKTMIQSIRDHLPHLWRRIERFRSERKKKNLRVIIEQGEREKTFRSGIDYEMFDNFLSGAIQEGIHPDVLVHARYSMADAFLSLMDIFMNGILTDAGRRQYEKVMKRRETGNRRRET